MIYWLFAGTAVLLIMGSVSNNRGGWDIGQALAGAAIYAIGRDVRRVLRE